MVSGEKSSHTETSKPNGVFWNTTPLSAPRASGIQRTRLTIDRCSTTTPFGRPVEPEV